MKLQTKLLLFIISLLVVTVVAVSYFAITSTTSSILAQTEQDGKAISKVLAQSSIFAERVPQQVDTILGEQMVVEARITAQLVAVALGRAGMSPAEVKAILKDITDNTVLDEFWITDPTGKAYLSNTDIDFTFSPDPTQQPQAYIFVQLLGEKNGVVIQEAQKREIDNRYFKYVGVSGIDSPRIVQVGYEADIIDELSKDVNTQKLIDELTGQANVAAIRVIDSEKKDVAVSNHPVNGIGSSLSADDEQLLDEAMSLKKPSSAYQNNILRIATPMLDGDGNVQNTILVYLTTENVQTAISDAVLRTVIVSVLVILAGILLSFLLSRGITRPIRKLTAAVQVMGQGDLSHMVEVETKDEVGVLARAFNKMAEDLKSYIEDLRRTTAEKERVEKELEIGRGIQQSFLPEKPPEVAGFEIAALNTPALEVGGDFYDFIPVTLDKWGLVIADVSGKGVPAALFMALSRTLIRANAVDNPTVSQAILKANKMLSEQDRANMFVTLFYGVLDTAKKAITYINAGHNPPLVLGKKGGDIVMLAAKGVALGIMPDITLEEKEVPLRQGDIVILFTDGVTESINRKQEQFGQQRLVKLVEENHDLSAQEIVHKIEQEVAAFSEGQAQFDDLTLVAVKVL